MYQVIILFKEEYNHSYYQSYVKSDDTTLGNISTNVLPPTQDILQAQSYWWDFDTESWVYDEEMYQKLLAEEDQAEKEAQQREKERQALPTAEEISEALMEIAQNQSDLFDAIAEIGDKLAAVMNN